MVQNTERGTTINDREFFDELLQLWAKTSHAEDRYWGYEPLDEMFDVFAYGPDEQKLFIGYTDKEVDADFITAVHGCFPDLIRRLHMALDEADSLDAEMDRVQNQLMEAELRVQELKAQIAEYEDDLEGLLG